MGLKRGGKKGKKKDPHTGYGYGKTGRNREPGAEYGRGKRGKKYI